MMFSQYKKKYLVILFLVINHCMFFDFLENNKNKNHNKNIMQFEIFIYFKLRIEKNKIIVKFLN